MMQEIQEIYTQIYLNSIQKYIYEKKVRAQKTLSQRANDAVKLFREIINVSKSTTDCISAVQEKIEIYPKNPLCDALQMVLDSFYVDEKLAAIEKQRETDKEETDREKLCRLKMQLQKEIDFFLIKQVANKNRPEQIQTLKQIINQFSSETEETRISAILAYLPKLRGPLGKSLLSDYLEEAVSKVRDRYPKDTKVLNERLEVDNAAYKNQVGILKHIIQHDREKHKTILSEKDAKHSSEIKELQDNMQEEITKRLVLEKKFTQQQAEITSLKTQMNVMLVLMEEFKQSVTPPKTVVLVQTSKLI